MTSVLMWRKVMYKVIVVDDEPVSITHISQIIEKKCKEFEVIDYASNGEEALGKVEVQRPNVVISDIKMPIMDGIALAFHMNKQFPEIIFIIVSGYQDFEYAKSAIKYGVNDYLLKPLNPNKLQECLEQVSKDIKKKHYLKRDNLMHKMCRGNKNVSEYEINKYFQEGKYFCGIVRKNGIPSMFFGSNGLEVFSLEEEQVYTYGRDEMECLYLVPKKLLYGQSFSAYIHKRYAMELNESQYVTCVYSENSFDLKDFSEVVKKIYKKLHVTVTIGFNKIITLNEKTPENTKRASEEELVELIGFLIKNKEYNKLKQKIEMIFDFWLENEYSQAKIEKRLYIILQQLISITDNAEELISIEFELNELLFNATSLKDVWENILEKVELLQTMKEDTANNNEQLFFFILSYLENNMGKNLSLNHVCKYFGVSQTTLSRWFRDYGNTTFNRYLTHIRIDQAKKIILSNPDIYIKDVSKMVGYTDQFYFSRLFRTVEGKSPSDFINLCVTKDDSFLS